MFEAERALNKTYNQFCWKRNCGWLKSKVIKDIKEKQFIKFAEVRCL